MKILIFAFFFGLVQIKTCAQPTAMLKRFLLDAVDTRLSNIDVANKYFCTAQLQRIDQDGEQTRQMLNGWLSIQRKDLRGKHLNLNEVKIALYDSLTADERPAKPFHMMEEASHTYVALYQGKIICFFLLSDDKIASTLLLAMGRENNFMDFCK